MIQTGIRQTEIINLNRSSYKEGILSISEGKLARRVALNGHSRRILNEYLESGEFTTENNEFWKG